MQSRMSANWFLVNQSVQDIFRTQHAAERRQASLEPTHQNAATCRIQHAKPNVSWILVNQSVQKMVIGAVWF
jgi:hypothetical protein